MNDGYMWPADDPLDTDITRMFTEAYEVLDVPAQLVTVQRWKGEPHFRIICA